MRTIGSIPIDGSQNARRWGMSGMRRVALPFVRGYARRELPFSLGALQWLGVNDQSLWADAPVVEFTGKRHAHRMRADLADFHQRLAYFAGQFSERHILATLDATLRAGDEFVDAGASTGLTTLHGAGIVGPGGRVHAFEPNSAVYEQFLRWHVEANDLGLVETHNAGLSDEEASLVLNVPDRGNVASGTLGPIPDRYQGDVAHANTVRTVRGDDAVSDDQRPLTILMDIEGFEPRALRGFERTLRSRRPAVITEINDEMLAMNGFTVDDLTEPLFSLGYRAFSPDLGWLRHAFRLRLWPLDRTNVARSKDVLWIVPGSVQWTRCLRLMKPDLRGSRGLSRTASR